MSQKNKSHSLKGICQIRSMLSSKTLHLLKKELGYYKYPHYLTLLPPKFN